MMISFGDCNDQLVIDQRTLLLDDLFDSKNLIFLLFPYLNSVFYISLFEFFWNRVNSSHLMSLLKGTKAVMVSPLTLKLTRYTGISATGLNKNLFTLYDFIDCD